MDSNDMLWAILGSLLIICVFVCCIQTTITTRKMVDAGYTQVQKQGTTDVMWVK